MGARDPYCGWDLLLKKCTTLEESVRMSQWEQSITKCPVSLLPDVYIHHFWFDQLHWLSLVCNFKVVRNTIILPPAFMLSSSRRVNTHIHLCSSGSHSLLCILSIHSQSTSSSPLTKPASETQPRRREGILGLNNLTLRE